MYLKTNGIELYYEIAGQGAPVITGGQGEPVILLHGNGEDHTIFDVLIKRLSESRMVYAIDSRDHGKSSKVKDLDYGDMMEDVAAFIRELDIHRPIVYGFSDGGIMGLLLAIKYPGLISKLIISGANTAPDGAKRIYMILLRILYFFTRDRKAKLMLTQPNITDAELNTITAPTLVLAGSREFVKDEHTKNIANNIRGSVLKILEGETHDSYVIHSEKLYDAIEPFIGEA